MSKQKVSAKEVLKDIRAGVSDAGIKEKYKISDKGLQSLFEKLIGAGVLTQADLDARSASRKARDSKVPAKPEPTPAKKPVAKIDAGLAKAIVADIKNGLHDNEIMRRHELSPGQFKKIVEKLAELGHLSQDDLAPRMPKKKAICPFCSAEIHPGDVRCKYCGQWLEGTPPPPETGVVPPMAGPPPPPYGLGVVEDIKECPWEDRESYGFFNAYFQTATKCLLTPAAFFSKLPTSGGYGSPILFGIVSVALSAPIAMILFWLIGKAPLVFGLYGIIMAFGCALVVATIFTPIALLIWSGIVHGVLYLLKGASEGFEATFRVVSYSFVTQLFNVIPHITALATIPYGLFLTAIGLRETHKTTTGKATAAVAIPVGVVVVIAMIVYLITMSMLAKAVTHKLSAGPRVAAEYKGETLPAELCNEIDTYLAKIDSAAALNDQSRQTQAGDAMNDLEEALDKFKDHPNIEEVRQTCVSYMLAAQFKAAFGKKLGVKPDSKDDPIRKKLMNMCGR